MMNELGKKVAVAILATAVQVLTDYFSTAKPAPKKK